MDPHAVLGVAPGASADEITSSYRELAKRWHPDRAPGAAAEARMVEINAAYELLRSEAWQARHAPAPARAGGGASARRAVAGQWLDASTRRALGPELLGALRPNEAVRLVTPVSVWASPQALLAVTDTRLLWLLDDAVTGRVRTLDFAAVTGVETRLSWPRRRTASLRVSRRNGRRPISFGELRPETARAISSLVRGEAVAA
jgi:DnaJ domain